ncbi:MAG: pilus assembly protein PilX [Moraxella sp.]|nr:pilus assembly protein PilX [Moraxella sp.]
MKREQGAVMIVVLVVLLLVAIAGTIALRSGVFGMRLSTNSQVGKLLSNNNDSALTKFEDMNMDEVWKNFTVGGMYYHLLDNATADDELVFCYDTKKSDIFTLTNAGIIKYNDSTEKTPNFCTHETFSSKRGIVITQVHLRKNTAETELAEGYTVSTSIPSIANNINLSLSAISVMPSYSNETAAADTTGIDDCLKRTAFKKTATTQTNAECFEEMGIPYNVQNTDYRSGNTITISK